MSVKFFVLDAAYWFGLPALACPAACSSSLDEDELSKGVIRLDLGS